MVIMVGEFFDRKLHSGFSGIQLRFGLVKSLKKNTSCVHESMNIVQKYSEHVIGALESLSETELKIRGEKSFGRFVADRPGEAFQP